mmetsp:Transcript_28133/g.57413  ORF Transcript_28133/g.57413 Transcript_28133/m.57413 type:complete len:140 (-) Transcript_28133:457-876(-)
MPNTQSHRNRITSSYPGVEPMLVTMSVRPLMPLKQWGLVNLPLPFHELNTVWDPRAKGSWIMVQVNTNWDVNVLKCRPGIRIIASTTYDSQEGMTFIQCHNVTQKSVRFLAIVIHKKTQSNVNEFSSCKDGIQPLLNPQ